MGWTRSQNNKNAQNMGSVDSFQSARVATRLIVSLSQLFIHINDFQMISTQLLQLSLLMKKQNTFQEICKKGGCVIQGLLIEKSLQLRLVVKINKNTPIIFEALIQKLQDLGKIAQQCKSFEDIITYMKDPSNIEIDIQNHTIIIIQRTGINKNKINQLFTIQLHETDIKSNSQIIADNIFEKCGKKGSISSDETKELFQMVGMCFGEILLDLKDIKKKKEANDEQIKNIREDIREIKVNMLTRQEQTKKEFHRELEQIRKHLGQLKQHATSKIQEKDSGTQFQQQRKKIEQKIKQETTGLEKKIKKSQDDWGKKFDSKIVEINKKLTDVETKKMDKTQVFNKIKEQISIVSRSNTLQLENIKKQLQKSLTNKKNTTNKQVQSKQIAELVIKNLQIQERISKLQQKLIQLKTSKVNNQQLQIKMAQQRNSIQKNLMEKLQIQTVSLSKKINVVQNLVATLKKDADIQKKDSDMNKNDMEKLKDQIKNLEKIKKQTKLQPKIQTKVQTKVQNKIQVKVQQKTRDEEKIITPVKKQKQQKPQLQKLQKLSKEVMKIQKKQQEQKMTPRMKTEGAVINPRPKKKIVEEPIKVIPSSIVAANWVDPQCCHSKNFSFKDNIIGNKIKEQIFILGKQSLKEKKQFKVAFTRLKKFAGVGIIDSSYNTKFDTYGLPNIFQYWSNGATYIGGKMQEQTQNYNQGQIIHIITNIQNGVIEWKIGDKVKHRVKNQIIKNEKIKWVPYIYLSSMQENVSLCD